ncbi:ribonucleotide-diphosphate reductase subunit beta [Enterococcus sp. DIV0800]|uniref:ribonucleotide-diphosphate reductase subunit beta n=1 Tax=unclassified Enterococcus TaxID=2608891 RepID=UPI003D3014B9
MSNNYLYYKAINWNVIEDELDNVVWEKATSLFWLDTRIPIEDDKEKWERLHLQEWEQLNRLLILLTNLSTYQSIESGQIIRNSERSQQEIAILNNLQFTEMINTKAYNRILCVFNRDINLQEEFNWVDNEPHVRKYLEKIDEIYQGTDPIKKRFIAMCVEGLLNYAYLAYLFELWIDKYFVNLGSMLEMIVRNESLHCYYLNHKVKILLKEASPEQTESFKDWAINVIDYFVNSAIHLINDFYNIENSKKIAINLIKQEANNIFTGVGIDRNYQFDDEILININKHLNELRKHNLSAHSYKNTVNAEELMDESDYNF